MNLRHKLEIPPDDPFKFDKLNREEEAKTLTDLVKNYSDGFVLALNNEWGAGKTTFVKMWQAYLEKEEVESLYFNAWENDYQEDVLVALIAELKELRPKAKRTFDKLVEKAGPIAVGIGKGMVKGIAKRVGAGEVAEVVLNEIADSSGDILKTEIENYGKRKKGIEEFRKSLETFVNPTKGKLPLVFIIDELDRCRPSYAVEVLEQIKHIFSVPGIVFVLAIDKVQLGHAVKGVYGSPGMDDVEYLRRFIDVKFSLPMPNTEDYVRYFYEYFSIENEIRITEIVAQQKNNYTYNFIESTILLVKYFKFNLRQIERLFAHLKIIYSTYNPHRELDPAVYVLLTILKLLDNSRSSSNLYMDIFSCSISEQELIDRLAEVLPTQYYTKYRGATIETLSHLYNNEKRASEPMWPALVIKSDGSGAFALPALNYRKFVADPKEVADTLNLLRNQGNISNLNMSDVIAHVELSEKYFQQ